jgi:hypothetical protein
MVKKNNGSDQKPSDATSGPDEGNFDFLAQVSTTKEERPEEGEQFNQTRKRKASVTSQYSKGSNGSKGQNQGHPSSIMLHTIGSNRTLDDKLRNLTSVLASRPSSKQKVSSKRKNSATASNIPKP